MITKILIADDHGVIRAGLRSLLNTMTNFEVVGEAADGEEVIKLVAELSPDVVLMDISMPGLGGIESTRQIVSVYPNVRVLILTVHEDEELLREAIRSGASGYIVKRAAETELRNAIQAVCRGEVYVHPSMTRSLITSITPDRQPINMGLEQLTPREIEVLQLLARGNTNRQIAQQLNISTRTVEGHRANLSAKLGLKSRVELVNFSEENGLLGLEK